MGGSAAPGREVPDQVRSDNRRLLRHLGFGRVPHDVGTVPPGPIREPAAVLDRALVLHVVVAVASGLDASVAQRWLEGFGAEGTVFDDEVEYLEDAADGIRTEDAARATSAEALAVLLWALQLVDALPLEGPATEASGVLPGPGEALPDEVAGAELRHDADLLAAHDLAAGMLWALRADPDLEVGAAPGSLDPYVVRQRHRAFAWLLGADW